MSDRVYCRHSKEIIGEQIVAHTHQGLIDFRDLVPAWLKLWRGTDFCDASVNGPIAVFRRAEDREDML